MKQRNSQTEIVYSDCLRQKGDNDLLLQFHLMAVNLNNIKWDDKKSVHHSQGY